MDHDFPLKVANKSLKNVAHDGEKCYVRLKRKCVVRKDHVWETCAGTGGQSQSSVHESMYQYITGKMLKKRRCEL